MPCILKIRVHEARDLPVMDRISESTDAYVIVRFAGEEELTRIVKRTLSPVFNEDFRFEVSDDSDVQNHPLELKIMDHDQVTRDGPIGNVYIDLNPLISNDILTEISGWFPIFDTIHGMRGDIRVTIKLDYFGDINRYKDSSAGVLFFSGASLPTGYKLLDMLGFVEELIVMDDPEYHWTDSFRSPRTSNEARQKAFFSLSGQLRRLLGKKVLEMGGNVVVGYQQNFELEREEGIIIARGIGTACKMKTVADILEEIAVVQSLNPAQETDAITTSLDSENSPPIGENLGSYTSTAVMSRLKKNPRAGEGALKLYTLKSYESGVITRIAGLVTARSVKIITDRRDIHDDWRTELREEIRSHSRSLGCLDVIGYTEHTTILDDLIVLSAMGTAVELNWNSSLPIRDLDGVGSERDPLDFMEVSPSPASHMMMKMNQSLSFKETMEDPRSGRRIPAECGACHLNPSGTPFKMAMKKCNVCKKALVPEIIICTAEPPPELAVIGEPKLLEVYVCKPKKKKEGESAATTVSDMLPFLEYDIHKQLLLKMKLLAVNAVFGYNLQITVAEDFIIAVGSGTAVFLAALPPPALLEIDSKVNNELYTRIQNTCAQNHAAMEAERSNWFTHVQAEEHYVRRRNSSMEDDEEELPDSLDDNLPPVVDDDEKTNYVIKVEDDTDDDLMSVLLSRNFGEGFHMFPVDTVSVIPLLLKPAEGKRLVLQNRQYLTLSKWINLKSAVHYPNKELTMIFAKMHSEIQFNLRNYRPCCVAGISIEMFPTGESSIQMNMTAIGLSCKEVEDETETNGMSLNNNGSNSGAIGHDLLFEMDTVDSVPSTKQNSTSTAKVVKSSSPDVSFSNTMHNIECTPMDEIPGAVIESYLGRLNLCFVKEQTIVPETGGLSTFCSRFIMEVQAIARAHVKAMSGNGVVGYKLDKLFVHETPNKNLAYALYCISGDVVSIVSAQQQAAS